MQPAIEPQAITLATCLAIDEMARSQLSRLRDCTEKLAQMVPRGARTIRLVMDLYGESLVKFHGTSTSALMMMPRGLGAPLLVALFHILLGSPLYFDEAIWNLWRTAGDGSVLACMSCGYRLPGGPPVLNGQCLLCGGSLVAPGDILALMNKPGSASARVQ